jgi:DNA-binding beta-propeller fold protein YncE
MQFMTPGAPQIGAVVRGTAPATSMAFHEDGTRLYVASEEDNKLQVIDCLKGEAAHPAIGCEREGIFLVEPT